MPAFPSGFYNRHDPTKGYVEVSYLAGRVIQSRELVESQRIERDRHGRLASSLYKDGAVVKDCAILVDAETGDCRAAAGQIYAAGDIHDVAEAAFRIPVNRLVAVGLYLQWSVATELDDPGLCDPAAESRNVGMPGAVRLKVAPAWGWDQDGQAGVNADFYPVYRVDNGVVLSNAPPPALDSVSVALARYDRAANGGSYVAKGLTVAFHATDAAAQEQIYTVSEGEAHIDGFEVIRPTGLRVRFPADPDTRLADTEPHAFTAATGGSQRINLNHAPLAAIVAVRGTVRVTETREHGVYQGCKDPLANGSVVRIVSVVQNATTYVEGSDYRLTDDTVDWSPNGVEPSTGSTYQVVYEYLAVLTPTGVDAAGFTVAGCVNATQVLITYRWKMPRCDRLVLQRDGTIARVRGIAHPYSPAKPEIPAGQLLLATVWQMWGDAPTLTNDSVRSVPCSTLERMGEDIVNLYMLVGYDRLKTRASSRDPSTKRGIFVDAFYDDTMRDLGLPAAQNDAAVLDGELTLPIFATVVDAPQGRDAKYTLSYRLSSALAQTLRTGSMKVNPYQTFEPLPSKVVLVNAVDQWTATEYADATRQIERMRVNDANWHDNRQLTYVVSKASSSDVVVGKRDAETLRSIAVNFTVSGFGPGERLASATFDGIGVAVAGSGVADDDGVLTGAFTVPAGIPAGVKKVEFVGEGGSRGSTTYTGSGTIETRQMRVVETIETHFYDPLAQTFALDVGRHIGGVNLWFVAKGSSPVRVQIRETSNGYPSRVVLAEGAVAAADIRTDGTATRIAWEPLWIEAGTEYALVVLTDDAEPEVMVAELGKFDRVAQTWVTRQPYAVGVLLSSSNASTWTAHQTADLAFDLLGCEFTATSREIDLGEITAEQVSDMVALARVERPAVDTDLTLIFTDRDGDELRVVNGQVVSLQARLDGPVSVKAVLTGTNLRSPVLYPGVQAVLGRLKDAATYTSRVIDCSGAAKLIVAYEALLSGTATVTAKVLKADGSWTEAPVTGGSSIGDGWQEVVRTIAIPVNATRVRLELTGSIVYRPRVRALQVIGL